MRIRRFFVRFPVALGLLVVLAVSLHAAPPRLTVVVVVDQMRADYLQRFSREYLGGFARLVQEGAVFTHARLGHVPAEGGPSHASLLTGCFPYQHGIVSSDWWDRAQGKEVDVVEDMKYGQSPANLMCATLGDALKAASPQSKVISISGKDRVAILMGGRKADMALWYNESAGQFVSSAYYGRVPDWIWTWDATLRIPSEQRSSLIQTTLLDDMTLELARHAIEEENLGKRDAPDILTIGLSATDYIGHYKDQGPDSLEMHNHLVALDRELGFFIDYLDRRLGRGNYTLVLTSPHGVLPVPETPAGKEMHAQRLSDNDFVPAMNLALNKRFGAPIVPGQEWIVDVEPLSIYLNAPMAKKMGVDFAVLQKEAARLISQHPAVSQVYLPEDLQPGHKAPGRFGDIFQRSFYPERSGDLMVLFKEGVLWEWKDWPMVTNHSTPYDYDARIPLVFMGFGIKPGQYDQVVLAEDLAPTLAEILGLNFPPRSPARVLEEAIQKNPEGNPASREPAFMKRSLPSVVPAP